MNRLAASLIVVGAFLYAMTPATVGAASAQPKTFDGDVLKIEGEYYTIHDTAGHEVRVHVDKTTALDGSFKVGDHVQVQMTEKAHALSIKHRMPVSGGMGSLGPQPIKGNLLKIEKDMYTIHDTSGHEIPVHVDQTTKQESPGSFKAGDKVEAMVNESGHALSLKHLPAGK